MTITISTTTTTMSASATAASAAASPPTATAATSSRQRMLALQQRMDRDHRPTMVQLRDTTLVDGMGTLTTGEIFRAQAYLHKKGRHFARVRESDMESGERPCGRAAAVAVNAAAAAAAVAEAEAVVRRAVASRKSAERKFDSIPDMLLTPAAVVPTGALSGGAWTLRGGKRKRVDSCEGGGQWER